MIDIDDVGRAWGMIGDLERSWSNVQFGASLGVPTARGLDELYGAVLDVMGLLDQLLDDLDGENVDVLGAVGIAHYLMLDPVRQVTAAVEGTGGKEPDPYHALQPTPMFAHARRALRDLLPADYFMNQLVMTLVATS
jgi:hypothetical protein